jgi:hypothetical protein
MEAGVRLHARTQRPEGETMKGKAALGLAALVLAALAITGAALGYTLADYQDAVAALQAVDPTIAPPANDAKRDFVVGGFGDVYGYNNGVSAQSDSNGGHVKGHISSTFPGPGTVNTQAGYRIRGDVICIAVDGKTAATGISGTITTPEGRNTPYTEVEWYRDGGPGGAMDGFGALSYDRPQDCLEFLSMAATAEPITHGNILINDAA